MSHTEKSCIVIATYLDVSDVVDNDLDYYDMYTKTFATAKDKTPAAPAAFSQHNPAGDSR